MYSEGKASKFYLPNADSHMDFNGHLNVKLRMKQYNLIFKFTELFTFMVQGPYDKPSFSAAAKTSKERVSLFYIGMLYRKEREERYDYFKEVAKLSEGSKS